MWRASATETRYGTVRRAKTFYANQVLDRLNGPMREFLARQDLVFISTADRQGRCDCSMIEVVG